MILVGVRRGRRRVQKKRKPFRPVPRGPIAAGKNQFPGREETLAERDQQPCPDKACLSVIKYQLLAYRPKNLHTTPCARAGFGVGFERHSVKLTFFSGVTNV